MRWPLLRRTLWPTREGWWSLVAALSLGVAAVNTGNNLFYLLLSILLGLIIVSGVLSEQSVRGLRLRVEAVDDLHAGRPALLGATVTNTKRWAASYSITLEVQADGVEDRSLHVPVLGPGAEGVVTWEETPLARGRQRLPGLRLTTRFPFGLFVKALPACPGPEVVVFPALVALSAETCRAFAGDGHQTARRRGHGHDLYNLRTYVRGDDPRLIHWRSSAKAGSLIVRELEAPTQLDTRIVLVGAGVRDGARLERGLSEAASLAVELLRAGAAVELAGPGVLVAAGTGRRQEREVLTALALYDPATAAGAARCQSLTRMREMRVVLG